MKVVIIGGVAAGMSAASKLKRINKNAQVVVYEKGGVLSYGACGLPYFISGESDDPNILIARPKEHFEEMGIEIHLKHEVRKVIPEKKQVLIKDLENNIEFHESYDKLMISTGSTPIIPRLPGVDLENIHVLKTLEDGIRLKELGNKPQIKNVVIVGAGYVGIEVAEAMREIGKNVKIIELGDRSLRTFDKEITDIAEMELRKQGVELHFGEKVEGFSGTTKVEQVQTDKNTYETDLVLLSIGTKPATQFLKNSGINLAKNGAVIVDREMLTNVEDIYSAGDCAEVYNRITEENTFIPLGTNANKCGRIAGANMAGNHIKYIGTLGSAAIKVFDLELARTGMSEIDIKNLTMDYETVFIKGKNHPGYYPNQTPIWIKLIYEKETKRILGAQAVGPQGVVLRINVFAVAIHNNMTTDELGMTDLCYAPPFAGVWDAIHIASNAAK